MPPLGREISCFLKATSNKLGDQYTLFVPNLKVGGTSLPRSLWLLRLWPVDDTVFKCFVIVNIILFLRNSDMKRIVALTVDIRH